MIKEKITLLRNKNLGSISVVAFELLIMAALCNKGHYIFVLWFLPSIFFLA